MSAEITVRNKDSFEVVVSAINRAVDLIRKTYGPAGKKVIISKLLFSGIVDDGVQIARELELPDREEQAIWREVKQIAIRTNDRVGDATTGSLIFAQALVNETSRLGKINAYQIEKELLKGLEELTLQLRKQAKKVITKEDLKKVALISFNNESIASMIADAYFKLGPDAIITMDKSPTMESSIEMSNGIRIGSGYISPYMITNPERMESILEKPYILLTDYRLTQADDLLPIMNLMAADNKRELVVICDNMEQHALATAVANRVKGMFLTIAIPIPSGEDKKVFMEDLALLTGAKLFSEAKGDKLETATIAHLGRAERFVSRRNESVIVSPKGKKTELKSLVSKLRQAISNEKSESTRKVIESRLAMLTNTLAVVKVGAATEGEQKSLRYKVEDTINAVKVALKGGVVAGGGFALKNVETSSQIMNAALKAPNRQLFENWGMDVPEGIEKLKNNEAFNLVTGQRGDCMKIGVIDPVDALIAGIESAVSIVNLMVSSCGMIVETQKKPPVVDGQ